MGALPWAGLLLLIGHTIQQGERPVLLPPENVTLTAENCRTFLTWQPALNSTNGTQYEVEIRKESGSIEETSCRGNHLRQTQRCELHLSDLHAHYKARVKARDGDRLSKWANSKALQLYKDMVIGPLNLSLAAADGRLTVVISLPYDAPGKLCPYLSILYVKINLTEGNNKPITEVTFKNLTYTFDSLPPDTNYCVHVKVLDQPAKKAIQCIRMPSSRAGDDWSFWVLLFVITAGVALVGVAGTLFIRQSLQLSPSEISFPKSLRFLNPQPSRSCPVWKPILCLEQSSIASLSTVMQPPDDNARTEQQTSPVSLISSGYRAWGSSDYCANGFGQGSSSSAEDPTSLPVAGLDPISSRETLKDEDPADGSYQMTPQLLESPVSCPKTCIMSSGIRTSSPGFRLYSRSSSNSILNHKTGSDCKEATSSPSFGAVISLNSLKLGSVPDVRSPMCSPRAYVIRKDYGTRLEAQPHKAMESQVCPTQPGCPEDPAIHSDSNLGTETVTFSGYESRQPIHSCERFREQHQVQETCKN